jgi:hypothetical protein
MRRPAWAEHESQKQPESGRSSNAGLLACAKPFATSITQPDARPNTNPVPSGVADIDLDAKIAEAGAEIKKLGGSLTNDNELAELGGCQNDYSTYLVMVATRGPERGDRRCTGCAGSVDVDRAARLCATVDHV